MMFLIHRQSTAMATSIPAAHPIKNILISRTNHSSGRRDSASVVLLLSGPPPLSLSLSGVSRMDENQEKRSGPRIPSDIRVYFSLLIGAGVFFLVLWLVLRFI
jgi:hypothetical protein